MPYLVSQLIEGRARPVCVRADDSVAKALTLMLEHDYSQLPVLQRLGTIDTANTLITYESILRASRHFKTWPEDLKVRDAMVKAPVKGDEDGVFDILDDVNAASAALIVNATKELVGIVTGYDLTAYFRRHTEDQMRVKDVELAVRDFIQIACTGKDGEVDKDRLNALIKKKAKIPMKDGQIKEFADLTLGDYIQMLLSEETWNAVEPILDVKPEYIKILLEGVRQTRNALSHFRDDITLEDRDRLQYAFEWFARRQDDYQADQEAKQLEETRSESIQGASAVTLGELTGSATGLVTPLGFVDQSDATSDSRYGPLADWLQGQPGNIDQVPLTFNQIEAILHADLPASARQHRAWWANDSVGHSHSQLWLEAGWRTSAINLTEGRVTFSRIAEREKAYIAFYSKLLDDLRQAGSIPLRDHLSPDGQNWLSLWTIPSGSADGSFNYSFSRDRRMRVELYLDLGDKPRTKAVFDRLHDDCGVFEAVLGPISWERLNDRRAARLAQYTPGHVYDDTDHPALRAWAVKTMSAFYKVLAQPAEHAIKEVRQA